MGQVLSVRRAGAGGTVQNGTSHFYGFDLQGNTRLMTDASGAVAATSTYTAFGEEVSSTGSVANAMRFGGEVGYYTDKISRVYVRARHYAPQQGRWMSQDPIGFDGGDWNFYRYVGNNPINRIDPSGQFVFGGAYGNCCGLFRPCNSGSPVIDCIDRACRSHDVCLATWREVINPCRLARCDRTLVFAALRCCNSGCNTAGPPSSPARCREAAAQIASYMGNIGTVPGWGKIAQTIIW